MNRPMRIWKYHGTGNDFVILEDLQDEHPLSSGLVAALCDRRFGVGADGVIRVTRGRDAPFFMDHRNADGGLAEMCGNGIRCLGKLVFERGHTRDTEFDVATRAGVKRLRLDVDGDEVRAVTVGMGAPAFARSEIPMDGPPSATFLQQRLEAGGASFTASAVSMGNPHLVVFLDEDPATFDVDGIGPLLERDERFPSRTNVEFVAAVDGGLQARVWERGVGETMACGTGACAALVAANEAGIVPNRAEVRFPGGLLQVERLDGDVLLTGPAECVFEATIDPAWLEARGLA